MNQFLHEYMHILSDPAHLCVELTFVLLLDVLFMGLMVPFLKRVVFKEHLTIDAEHGVDHDNPNAGVIASWTFQ